VANPYPNRELDSNCSVPVAVYRILRRQPWKTMARRTWNTISRLFLSTLFATFLTVLLATAAQARTYEVLTADVPFKFNVGNRTFRAGHYQLIFVGTGLLALRDARGHIIASLVARSTDTVGRPHATKLIFETQRKRAHLAQIWIEDRPQVLEVLGEQLAVRQAPAPPPAFRPDIDSLFERRAAPGLKR
jgi:hypothetical protein